MYHLLLLRGDPPLETCVICLNDVEYDEMLCVNLWIRHVLLRNVRFLSLKPYMDESLLFEVNNVPIASQRLIRLELSFIQFNNSFLDFSRCPALEVLEISFSSFSGCNRISSESLKSLTIRSSSFRMRHRTRVYTPNLVSLLLEVGSCRAPLLQRMPSLVNAILELSNSDMDRCFNSNPGDCSDKNCISCYEIDGDARNSVILQGLSEAEDLVLISDTGSFIFRRDLNRAPIFSNLKRLILNEYWCVSIDLIADLTPLSYMLQHSPILEKLTLQLFCKGINNKVEIIGNPDSTGAPAVTSHLKIVKVQCEVFDNIVGQEKLYKVLQQLERVDVILLPDVCRSAIFSDGSLRSSAVYKLNLSTIVS
ncbi:hypothetical protein EJB05_57747, partial [Eragrostis curvula]